MLSRTSSIAKPTRSRFMARNWRRIGCLIGFCGVLATCVVVASPFVIALRLLQEYVPVEEFKDERYCLIPLVFALLLVPSRVRPWIGYSFGARSGNRRFGRRVIPESIAFLQYDLRRWMMVLIGCQLVCLAAAYWGLYDVGGELGRIRSIYWLIAIPLGCGVIAFALTFLGQAVFLRTRGRKRGMWKVNRRRGVPLRDFIWKWDTTCRPIFERCRISRRVAGAFAAVTLSAASWFAAMGCLGSILAPHHSIAVAINCFSLPATLWFWPTPRRLVRWTARIIDHAP